MKKTTKESMSIQKEEIEKYQGQGWTVDFKPNRFGGYNIHRFVKPEKYQYNPNSGGSLQFAGPTYK